MEDNDGSLISKKLSPQAPASDHGTAAVIIFKLTTTGPEPAGVDVEEHDKIIRLLRSEGELNRVAYDAR